MSRKAVSIALTELVELLGQPTADQGITDVRCRLCGWRRGAPDQERALDEAAGHLTAAHRAQGGRHRRPHARQLHRRRRR